MYTQIGCLEAFYISNILVNPPSSSGKKVGPGRHENIPADHESERNF